MEKQRARLRRVVRLQAAVYGIYVALRVFFALAAAAPWLRAAAGLAAGALACCGCLNPWTTRGMLCMSFVLTQMAADALCAPLWVLVCAESRTGVFFECWSFGLLGAALLALLMLYGAVNETRVRRTARTFRSPKLKHSYRIAVLSDLHYGTIQSGAVLHRTLAEINQSRPDLVLLLGDVAEEHTSGEQMRLLFCELSALQAPGGVFFVHGNHDKQQKLPAEKRTYQDAEFDQAMSAAGIRCLDDDCVCFGEDLRILGRNDLSVKDRRSAPALLALDSGEKYTVVAEHRPEGCEELSRLGADLHLSGHYHGAQNWPNNLLYRLAGIRYNGDYQVGDMQMYVNAGVTGSKYRVRTHAHCEYLLLELEPKECAPSSAGPCGAQEGPAPAQAPPKGEQREPGVGEQQGAFGLKGEEQNGVCGL